MTDFYIGSNKDFCRLLSKSSDFLHFNFEGLTDQHKPKHNDMYICCGSILSLVQILFPLYQTHYHQITITKTKEIKFEPRIKLNDNT